MPLFFTVTPKDANVEIEELKGAFNGVSYTTDKDYMSFGSLTKLKVEKLENNGDGSYTLHTKFYADDKPIVKKTTESYDYSRPKISIKLKGGKVSNEVAVKFKYTAPKK